MTCGMCGRDATVQRLPRGWKACGPLVLCRKCRRERFRLRSITLTVAGPIGATWHEFGAAIEEAWSPSARLAISDCEWELTVADRQSLLRVSVARRWWVLGVVIANLSRGQRDTCQKIASGQAVVGDLVLFRDSRPAPRGLPSQIVCRIVALLPREQRENAPGQRMMARVSHPHPSIRNQDIREIEIGNLRKAILANWVSFPAQVPTFPGCGPADMQRRLVQLYFESGWGCADLAARYGLVQQQVRHILNAWKWRATNAGYIQHIPPADVIRELKTVRSALCDHSGDPLPCLPYLFSGLVGAANSTRTATTTFTPRAVA